MTRHGLAASTVSAAYLSGAVAFASTDTTNAAYLGVLLGIVSHQSFRRRRRAR